MTIEEKPKSSVFEITMNRKEAYNLIKELVDSLERSSEYVMTSYFQIPAIQVKQEDGTKEYPNGIIFAVEKE